MEDMDREVPPAVSHLMMGSKNHEKLSLVQMGHLNDLEVRQSNLDVVGTHGVMTITCSLGGLVPHNQHYYSYGIQNCIGILVDVCVCKLLEHI